MSLRAGVVWVALALICAEPCLAGAWTRERGEWYAKLALGHLVTDVEFDENGNERPFQFDGEFTDSSATLYAEYGLRDRLTLFGSLPYKTIHYENFIEQGDTSGLADVELGLRYRIVHAPVVFSIQALMRVPGGYDGEDRLPLGNDQIDTELRLLLGHAPGRGRFYYGVEAGYRSRAEAPSDEWRYLIEVGGSLTRRLYARAKLDEIQSAGNAADVRDVFGNPVATLEAELRRVELTAGWRIGSAWGVEAAHTPTLDGRSTAKTRTYAVAAVYRGGQ